MKRLLVLLAVLFSASYVEAATRCAPSAAPAGGCTASYASMQAAITAAVAGDTVYGHAGTTYTESITLPNKGLLASYITITSDASSSDLPAANVRTGPSYTAFLTAIKSPGGGVSDVYFAPGANHYKFTHVWFKNVPAGFGDIVAFGFSDSSQFLEAQEPTDAIFDQIYMTGDSLAGQKRGFNLNGKRFTLTNSYIKDIHSVGQDSQCIGGGNGHGPYDIENNYLECATENFIQGGFDPPIQTRMHVTGTPTTTSADVTVYQSGHTLAELKVGQFIAIQTVAGTPTYNSLQYSTISTITGTGTTGTLTFAALTAAPIVGGDIRAQVVPDGITFRRNYVTKNTNWFLGPILAPASPTTTGSTASGSLPAGQWCYKVQAFSLNGYQNNTVNSALATPSSECATITATGKVTVAFTATTGATSYRIWRGTSPGGENQWTSVTAVSTVDDGTLIWTSGTPFGATQIATKNLFELKCATNVQVDSNIFIHHRKGSDIGYALWLKTVNQDGTAWGCQTKNVTIEKNIWADINGWLEVHGQEASGNPFPGPLTNLTVKNNLVYGSLNTNGGDIYAFNITQAAANVVIDHNTVINVTSGGGGGLLVVDSTQAALTGFVFKNNMVRSETYGIHDPAGTGAAALTAAAPGFSFINNGVGAGTAPPYTAASGNVYSSLVTWKAAFTTYTDDGSGGADYTIVGGAPGANYRLAGSDAKDLGADIAAVNAATAGVSAGTGSTVAITLPVLPTGVRTVSYSATETASGGTAPYTYAVTAGTAPAGLSLGSNGVWTGTPTTATTYTFTVTVTDNVAATATQAYTVIILPALSISTTSPLTAGVLNHVYTATVAYTGGQAPFVCSVSSGSLPTGVTLDASTCVLSGTPTVAAVSTFSILVSGSLGSTATLASASLTVAAESLPAGRPVSVGPITHEAQVFRRAAAPTNPTDRIVTGDVWIDISADPPAHKTFTAAGVWLLDNSGGGLSGDGSALTSLNASQLTSGTIPSAVFPASLTISANVTVPIFGPATSLNLTGFADWTETTCGALSAAGHYRLCADAVTHTLQLSSNGGAYAALGSGGGSSSSATLPAITSVNSVVTTGNGVGGIVAKAGYFAGVNGNQTDTVLLTNASRGIYRICAVQNVTTAATTSSTMPALTIIWTNSSGSHSTTLLPANSGNTTASGEQACKDFSVSPGSQIHWDLGVTTGAYASSGATALLFDFVMTAEFLN